MKAGSGDQGEIITQEKAFTWITKTVMHRYADPQADITDCIEKLQVFLHASKEINPDREKVQPMPELRRARAEVERLARCGALKKEEYRILLQAIETFQ